MPNPSRYQNRIELLQGTLDLLILQTLMWGPQHGYGISQVIRANSGEAVAFRALALEAAPGSDVGDPECRGQGE